MGPGFYMRQRFNIIIFSQAQLLMLDQTLKLRQYFSKKEVLKVEHYLIGEVIGKGGYATVHKALQIFTRNEVAVKIINLEDLTDIQMRRLKREIEIHRSLNHPNIVKIYEYFQQYSKLYIIMELIEGRELFQHISRNGPLQEIFAAKVFHQICMTVKYLHDKGIAHRDIKTQNILIDSQFNIKLIDFGLAKRINTQEQAEYLQTWCGSPSYVAPEMMQRKKYDGKCIDIWCLGVTLFVMLQAHYPFNQKGDKLLKQTIDQFKLQPPRLSSFEALEVFRIIFRQTDKRCNISQLMDSDFFKKYSLRASDRQYHEMSKKDQILKIQLNSAKITKISNLLKIDPNQVKINIIQKVLSPSLHLLTSFFKVKIKMSNNQNSPRSKISGSIFNDQKLNEKIFILNTYRSQKIQNSTTNKIRKNRLKKNQVKASHKQQQQVDLEKEKKPKSLYLKQHLSQQMLKYFLTNHQTRPPKTSTQEYYMFKPQKNKQLLQKMSLISIWIHQYVLNFTNFQISKKICVDFKLGSIQHYNLFIEAGECERSLKIKLDFGSTLFLGDGWIANAFMILVKKLAQDQPQRRVRQFCFLKIISEFDREHEKNSFTKFLRIKKQKINFWSKSQLILLIPKRKQEFTKNTKLP